MDSKVMRNVFFISSFILFVIPGDYCVRPLKGMPLFIKHINGLYFDSLNNSLGVYIHTVHPV